MKHFRYHEGDWRYDKATREVIVQGHRLPVCTERAPRPCAFPITRLGESEWRIAPCVYVEGHFHQVPDFDFLLLTHAPQSVNVDLASLCQD